MQMVLLVFLLSLCFFIPAVADVGMLNTAKENVQEQAMLLASQKVSQGSSNWTFYSGAHLRTAFHNLANTVDLDNDKDSDRLHYLAYAYDFTLDLRHLNGLEAYAFIERRGRADYDAPLSGNRQIETIFGRYHWYNRSAASPRLRSFWVELPLNAADDLNFKFGLYPYGQEVGHRIALGGKYENYGVTLSGKNEALDWNLHWEKEDLNNRIHLGKVIDFDKVNKYNDTAAYFYAGDATLKLGKHRAQVYLGWLQDWTPQNARASKFNTRVKKENLVTPGIYLSLNPGKFSFGLEGAKNLGKAESEDSANKDVTHKGYLIIGDASFNYGPFKPKYKIFVASGNKFNEGNFQNTTISGGDNRAFSVFSPLNTNLTDSHYQKQYGPYVAMAGGYAVNFGVQRPTTFGDPYYWENIVAQTVGFDWTPWEKWYIGIDYWYLHSKENGFSRNEYGNIEKLPTHLGSEFDIFVSYQLTKNIKLSLLGGYFLPGQYYKQVRTDTAANNVFSATPRRDGKADDAYQLELGVDITF